MKTNENGQMSIGSDAAIKLAESGWWNGKSAREIAEFQIMTAELCMPFSLFHGAITEALGRDVYTHEFGVNLKGLMDELFNGKEPPTLTEIIGMLPADKTVVVTSGESV